MLLKIMLLFLKLIVVLKCNNFFFWDKILITFEEYTKLQSQTYTWLCRRVYDIELCKSRSRKGKIQEFIAKVNFFFGKNVYPLSIGQVLAHSYI